MEQNKEMLPPQRRAVPGGGLVLWAEEQGSTCKADRVQLWAPTSTFHWSLAVTWDAETESPWAFLSLINGGQSAPLHLPPTSPGPLLAGLPLTPQMKARPTSSE